jgi:hypothetical protein
MTQDYPNIDREDLISYIKVNDPFYSEVNFILYSYDELVHIKNQIDVEKTKIEKTNYTVNTGFR